MTKSNFKIKVSDAKAARELELKAAEFDYLTDKEVCQIMNLSSKQLQRMRQAGQIPYYQPTERRILYKRSELEAWLNGKRVESVGLPFEFLTKAEACKYLQVSGVHLYRLVSEGQIPCYRPTPRRIFFKRSELSAWIEASRVMPMAEVQAQAEQIRLENLRNKKRR